MRVEGEDAAMNLFGMPVGSCLLNQNEESAEMLSPAVARASGWNCTPHIGYSWEDSIASGILSDDQPVTLNPGATCLTAW